MNYKNIVTAIIAALLTVQSGLVAQSGFIRYYPTTYDKTSREILRTSDGGYLIAGVTNTTDPNDCQAYVMKVNSGGDFEWDHIYGGAKPDYPYSMVQTTEGDFLIAGFSQSYGSGDYDIYLLKIKNDGTELGRWTYGGSGNEEAREIIPTADGNYALVGTTSSSVSSRQIIMLIVNSSGAILQNWKFGGAGEEFGNSVQQCADGGFVILGQTFSFGSQGETYLVRINSSGTKLWESHFPGSVYAEGIAVVADISGSFTFIVRDSTSTADIDVVVMRADAGGSLIPGNTRRYGAALKDTPKRIRATPDGGYIIGAISRSFEPPQPDPPPDMWILKLNSSLDTMWTRLFGLEEHEHCHDVKPSADGGYIAVGHTGSYPSPNRKIYFVKMNGNGDVVVSLTENKLVASLNIFPNPSTGNIYVECGNSAPILISVFNAMGQLVYQGTNEAIRPGEPRVVNMNGYPHGFYLLSVLSGTEKVTKKIFIQ
jgi:hypothetical protein